MLLESGKEWVDRVRVNRVCGGLRVCMESWWIEYVGKECYRASVMYVTRMGCEDGL